MTQYIDKSAVVAELERLISNGQTKLKESEECKDYESYVASAERIATCIHVLSFLDTLEVKDPYEQCIQYSTVKDGIQAYAETYSFNIESELFNQLTKEQQALWRKEIEQACINGGDAGVELAKDHRYKENFEVKEVNLEKEFDKYCEDLCAIDIQEEPFTKMYDCAKHFFELGLKAQKQIKEK